jgi:cytochrome c-type biogenesis protein CcmF
MTNPGVSLWAILGLALAAGLAVAALFPLLGRNLLRTPLTIWGMVIAHFGIAISVVGMSAESGWTSEKLAALAVGESAEVGAWKVKLIEVTPVVGDNWIAIEGRMKASSGDQTFQLKPQMRQFFSPTQQTTEAALLTRWNGQLYAVIAPATSDSREKWQVRLWWKPLVTLIWFGGLVIAFGGFLAFVGRLRIRFRRKTDENVWRQS